MNIAEAQIVLWIQEHLRVPILNGPISILTRLGDGGILWVVIALILIAIPKTRKVGVLCAGSMVIALIFVNVCLKPIIARVRPYDVPEFSNLIKLLVPAEHDFSFPSGHSSNSFACAWVLFRLRNRENGFAKFGIAALVFAIMISLSRLYVGVHYPTDVIVGITAGILSAELAIAVLPKLMRKMAKRGKL